MFLFKLGGIHKPCFSLHRLRFLDFLNLLESIIALNEVTSQTGDYLTAYIAYLVLC